MTWAFQSVTTKQSGSGTVAVNYPSSLAVGDTVFLFCARGFGSGITFSAADFTPLVSRNTQNSAAILYRVVDGTEGATENVSSTPSNNCTYWMARFTGGPSSANFAASIINTATAGFNNTGLHWTSLTIGAGNDNGLVLVLATKQASLTSYDVPATWTGEIVHSVTSDGGQSFVSDYQIQSTATSITSGNWAVTGDASAVNQVVMAAILPAVAVVAPPSSGGIFVCP